MEIGYKLYFKKDTKNLIYILGERFGNVVETTFEEDWNNILKYLNVEKENILSIQLNYGEYRYEILNSHKIILENGEIKFILRPAITSTKTQILSDGIDFTTITADIVDYYSINGEGQYFVNPLEFSSQLIGKYTITAHSETNGNSSITIEVI